MARSAGPLITIDAARGFPSGFSAGAMPKRASCKFFARGACLKGEHCDFSHDFKPLPINNICTCYEKAICDAFDEHVKVSKSASEKNLSVSPDLTIWDEGEVDVPGPTCIHDENRPPHASRDDVCPVCLKRRKKRSDALRSSQEIECGVCLERVLSKPTASERKFGILSECDHPFCISCIRKWRSSSPSSGIDVNSALRACPMCRKVSYFVVPSVAWYETEEEKLEIIDSYKAKLKTIDCKHFDFGNGECPFGTNCFYRHCCGDESES
ncbi:hypothetical protein M569_14498 [Genlisea aurea]|uniref:RING-type E3 ubiquitin transferase n=1 Tax=Genlisea aurea TaxID=192259 RepID=S8C7C8_9LAMI|nr:hypothetical protein M569_14498 [Genlisea aurea]